jgi:hypothetical protein
MSEVTVKLTTNIARAILGDIVENATKTSYAGNKGWSWWAYDSTDKGYPFGSGVVVVEQRPQNTDNNWDKTEGDTEVVFRFELDDTEEFLYFRVLGEYTSYNGDTWNEGTFKEVRPTKVVKRLYEAVK